MMGGNAAYPVPGTTATRACKASYIFNVATNVPKDQRPQHRPLVPLRDRTRQRRRARLGGLNETATAPSKPNTSPRRPRVGCRTHGNQTYHFWGCSRQCCSCKTAGSSTPAAHVFGPGLSGTGASIYDYTTAAITDVPGLRYKDTRDKETVVLLPPPRRRRYMILGGGNGDTNVDAIRSTDLSSTSPCEPRYVPGPDLPQGTTADRQHMARALGDGPRGRAEPAPGQNVRARRCCCPTEGAGNRRRTAQPGGPGLRGQHLRPRRQRLHPVGPTRSNGCTTRSPSCCFRRTGCVDR